MISNMESLYFACMAFCRDFFHFVCEEQKMQRRYEDDYTKYRIMEHEKEVLKHRYNRLVDAVERCEEERKK